MTINLSQVNNFWGKKQTIYLHQEDVDIESLGNHQYFVQILDHK